MNGYQKELNAAEMLASLVMGSAKSEQAVASVQRSHRFPLPEFIQVENLARMGGVSVSQIINDLIECGLDAVKAKLPPDMVKEVMQATKDQIDRKTVVATTAVKRSRAVGVQRRMG